MNKAKLLQDEQNKNLFVKTLESKNPHVHQNPNVFTNQNIKFHLENVSKNRVSLGKLANPLECKYEMFSKTNYSHAGLRSFATLQGFENKRNPNLTFSKKAMRTHRLWPRNFFDNGETMKNACISGRLINEELPQSSQLRNRRTSKVKDMYKTTEAFNKPLLQAPVNFKSAINKIQVVLIDKLSSLKINKEDDRLSSERISTIFEVLKTIGEEKSIFQDYFTQIIKELHRAIYCKPGEFCTLFGLENINTDGNPQE